MKGIERSAAIVCEHIASRKHPILYGSRDEPLEAEDSGWQFVCNSGLDEDDGRAQVWSVGTVVAAEPSLADLVDKPAGTTLTRVDANSPWIVGERGEG